MNLAEMSWVRAERALAQTNLALVPVGAVEVYGPHLPQGSDGFAAQEIARRLEERVDAVVTPLVPIGCSQALMSFPGTLSVTSESLKAYLTDVCESLSIWGIKRILFLNGHAGNVPAIGEICREFIAKGINCAQVDWWRAISKAAPDVAETDELAVGHAGEVCTSVLMALREDLVVPEEMVKEMPKRGLIGEYPEVMQYHITYRQITASGVIGDATMATREKGEAMVEKFLDRTVAFLAEWQ